MIIQDWLRASTDTLIRAQITSARLDCLILLEDTIQKDRSWLLANLEYELDSNNIQVLENLLIRRSNHEPLAYIRGKCQFYGREFIVSPATLQPRPETETMIELLVQHLEYLPKRDNTNTVICDIGTGSGCLAITSKLEVSDVVVYATDINSDALGIAMQNSRKLYATIEFLHGHLLEPLEYQISKIKNTIILANLPYVPDDYTINQAAIQEPRVAIFGGHDGLDLYRQMFGQIDGLQAKPVVILVESLPFQHLELANIANSSGYKLENTQDLIQVFSLWD